jgi:hypothetical protein
MYQQNSTSKTPNTNNKPVANTSSTPPAEGAVKRPRKEVFSVVTDEKNEERWHKLGVAFVNKDDSLTILLDAMPLGRKLMIRDPKAKDAEGGQ